MTTKKKLIIFAGALAAIVTIVAFSIRANRQEAVPVETSKVEKARELIAIVEATGEIRPKEYVELQAEISGVITNLLVQEGDRVEKGRVLLNIDPIQTRTETEAQQALLEATQAEARNQAGQIAVQKTNLQRDLAGVRVAEAELSKARQNFHLMRNVFERKQQLFEDNLISRDAYETAQNDLINAEAAFETAEVRLEQAEAQHEVSKVVVEQAEASYQSALSRVEQQKAMLARSTDLLAKTTIRAPLTGVITQMNVEVGERAVPGTLNNPAATLMVIADLSVIEAEVEVDETDIVDLELGQTADVTVDALPDQPLLGRVTEIGNSAIQTGTSQQEAKDFEVVIQLQEPPRVLRPGLSCTGEITTAVRNNVLTIPIQALTIREFRLGEQGALIRAEGEAGEETAADQSTEMAEIEGVFRVSQGRATFVPVETGIIGGAEIEVVSGLDEGDTIVSGDYKTLRTLQDGDAVEIERE